MLGVRAPLLRGHGRDLLAQARRRRRRRAKKGGRRSSRGFARGGGGSFFFFGAGSASGIVGAPSPGFRFIGFGRRFARAAGRRRRGSAPLLLVVLPPKDDDDDESDDDAVPLASRSVDELKAICRRRNLRVGGKKAELVQRIVDDDGGVREPSKKKRRVRKRNWGRGSMSGQQLGAMASAMRVVLPEQLPTPALVSREAPAQRADHVCTCLSGHPDRCSAPVHLCACCTGNFAACRATAHNCNCTTMISLLSSRTIPCRTVWEDAVTGTRSRRWRGASEILFPHRCRAHVHRCRCDNPSHKCLSRVHKCICGTVLGKCLKHPNRKK